MHFNKEQILSEILRRERMKHLSVESKQLRALSDEELHSEALKLL